MMYVLVSGHVDRGVGPDHPHGNSYRVLQTHLVLGLCLHHGRMMLYQEEGGQSTLNLLREGRLVNCVERG